MHRIIVLAAGVWGCFLPPAQNTGGFTVPPERFFARTERLQLVPARIPDDVRVSQDVVAAIDSALAVTAALLGVEVVPAHEYATIWRRLTREAGGFFDPYTGRRDEPEFDAAVSQLYRELEERFHPDALLYPELIVVEALVEGNEARWGGTAQRLDDAPEPGSAVLALTLAVAIDDLEGNELYYREAGLVILDEAEGWVPHEALREDPAVVVRAAGAVLEPLVDEARNRVQSGSAAGDQTK